MADKINEMEKADRVEHADRIPVDEPTILAGDLHAAIGKLKSGSGCPILVPGSRTLANGS